MKSKIKFTTRFTYCCSFQFQVLCQNFLNATNSKDRPTIDGKNSAKCGANLLAEHWKHWTPISNVTMLSLWDFADPQGEFYKFHSLLGSVGELSVDKLWVLSIMPKIPEISVGIQMERFVSVSSDRNIRDHLWRWSTYFGWNIPIEIRRSIFDKPVLCPN